MPGHCYSCGAQFGVFKKEHGCKNCGFAFCTKCLHEKKMPVPKRNNEKHNVCVKCYKILTGQDQNEPNPAQYELPQAYLKRVAALKERENKPPQSKSQATTTPQKIPAELQNLDKADRDIALRLQRLKESDKPKEKVSDGDLNSRLANLKGEKYSGDRKPAYQAPDRRAEIEQVDDLLDEIAAEVEIDSHAPDPVRDVEARLAHLRYGEDGAKAKDESEGSNTGATNNLSTSNISKTSTKPSGQVSSSSEDGNKVDMEEMQQLMEATAKELEIDAEKALEGMKKDKELMKRLAEIKKRKKEKGNDEADHDQSEATAGSNVESGDLKLDADDDNDDNSESEEVAAKRIIERYLEEAKIDEKMNDLKSPDTSSEKKSKKREKKKKDLESSNLTTKKTGGDDLVGSDYDDSDELPYCCICTEDAILRCKDCGLDLYCKRCFRECHGEMGLTDHVTTPYKAPKGYR